MRVTRVPFVAAATLAAGSCAPEAPVPCGYVSQVVVHVGEEAIHYGTCFDDPQGGTLLYEVRSADVSIARTRLGVGSIGADGVDVTIEGRSVGETTVTVTATNEAGLSESLDIPVRVPNRPPEYVAALTEDAVGVGRTLLWDLEDFFDDPDREELTIAVTSGSAVTGATVAGGIARVAGLAAGQSEVTLTATDPHGEVATGKVVVDVWVPQLVFEDDFATEESLSDWEEPNEWTELSIADGVLTVTAATSDRYGTVGRPVGRVEYPCVYFATRAAASEDHPGIAWHTASGSERFYRLVFRRDDRWVLAIWIDSASGYKTIGRGTSPLISLDEFQSYSLCVDDMSVRVLIGGEEAISLFFGAVTTMTRLRLWGWINGTEYDNVALTGAPTGQP